AGFQSLVRRSKQIHLNRGREQLRCKQQVFAIWPDIVYAKVVPEQFLDAFGRRKVTLHYEAIPPQAGHFDQSSDAGAAFLQGIENVGCEPTFADKERSLT